MNAAVAHARRRHPSARWPAPIDGLRQRMTQYLALHGARHPAVAASLLEVRGRVGCDVDEFAHRLGIEPDLLRRAEAGEVSAARLPGRLRRMVSST